MIPVSPVARWDARWKLAGLVLACALTSAIQSPAACAISLAIALTLVSLAHLITRRFLSRFGLIALSLLPFLIALPFSEGGTLLAAAAGLRALAIGTFAYVLVAAEPFDRTLAASHSLGVPGPLVLIARLAHRYTATLFDEFRRLRTAWSTRAFRATTTRHAYRTYAHGLGAVLLRSADRGERVSAAMRARGFDGTLRNPRGFHATAADAFAFAALMLAVSGVLAWDRLA